MGLYTYFGENDKVKYSSVSNKVLNELFQEVREIIPDVYISERQIEIPKGFFSKQKKNIYTVYHVPDDSLEARCLSLDMSTEAHVFNYLCGLINGYHRFPNKKSEDQ